MQVYEKLGVFYLGKIVDPLTGKTENEPLLYESKNLTTHAVCVGMTGSGKTGLGISILEEAAIDNIPALIIDPKGDLSNLLLTFPELSPEEFEPWIDESEAEKKGMSTAEYAAYTSKKWKEGLNDWQEDADRIKKLRNAVDLAIYTPASNAGIPISILSSFAAPSKEELLDSTAMRDKIMSVTSSLLGLLGIVADPIKSREHILISTIIQQAWENETDLDIASLIQKVQTPPFSKIGALTVDTFYPPKERMALSISLNNLLASPGFQAWMEGVPLDIQRLLYSEKGKPKLSIISIAHLSDSERMFFVTLLLNAVLTWMRRQSGTSSLRALLYMDEIFGFFPPTATPPTKLPMLTLLKQARAFGVGVVLCTQNPVDLDYKGLANCGTWFIGKLQTERDKMRVLEGLSTASNGELDSSTLDKMLAQTGNRIFIMRSVYNKDPILFQTRWTLSYLRGPLTLTQIAALTKKSPIERRPATRIEKSAAATDNSKPALPPGINEFFLHPTNLDTPVNYIPKFAGFAKLHFVDAKFKIDVWQDVCLLAPPDDEGKSISWDQATSIPELKAQLKKEGIPNSTFSEVPSCFLQEKNYVNFSKDLSNALYQNQTLSVYQTTNPFLISKPGESEADFRARVILEMHEKRDELVQKIREKYESKLTALSDRIQRSQSKLEDKQQKAWIQKIQTFITFLTTLLGAIFGRKLTKGTITEAGTTLRRAGRMSKDSQDAAQAEETVADQKLKMKVLQDQMNAEIGELSTSMTPDSINVEVTLVRPRKSDISVDKIALIFCNERT